MYAINSTEYTIKNSTNSLPFKKHCRGFYSIPLIRENHDFCFYYVHYKTCESNFADVPFLVVFSPIKNFYTGILPKKVIPSDNYLPIQDIFAHFLNKLQEANEFSE